MTATLLLTVPCQFTCYPKRMNCIWTTLPRLVYGCDTWSGVLRGGGVRRVEKTRNEELHGLYCLLNIVG